MFMQAMWHATHFTIFASLWTLCAGVFRRVAAPHV
ncbi:hypothetical protein ABH931_004241 [Streptacidiphilus sp. MAP12-33]